MGSVGFRVSGSAGRPSASDAGGKGVLNSPRGGAERGEEVNGINLKNKRVRWGKYIWWVTAAWIKSPPVRKGLKGLGHFAF